MFGKHVLRIGRYRAQAGQARDILFRRAAAPKCFRFNRLGPTHGSNIELFLRLGFRSGFFWRAGGLSGGPRHWDNERPGPIWQHRQLLGRLDLDDFCGRPRSRGRCFGQCQSRWELFEQISRISCIFLRSLHRPAAWPRTIAGRDNLYGRVFHLFARGVGFGADSPHDRSSKDGLLQFGKLGSHLGPRGAWRLWLRRGDGLLLSKRWLSRRCRVRPDENLPCREETEAVTREYSDACRRFTPYPKIAVHEVFRAAMAPHIDRPPAASIETLRAPANTSGSGRIGP